MGSNIYEPASASTQDAAGGMPAAVHGHLGGYAGTSYAFTITDEDVTGMQKIVGTRAIAMELPAEATFTVSGGTVTETLLYGSATEALTYVANDSNNGTYFLAHDLKTFDTRSANARSYGFMVIDGILMSLAEGRGVAGSTQTVDVTRLAATAFAINGDTITETSVQRNVVETLTFVARDGSSYHLAPSLKTFISAGDATTMLFVESTERMTLH